MSILAQAAELKERLSRVLTTATYSSNTDVLAMPTGYIEDWAPGKQYAKGNVCLYKDVKYLVAQSTTAQAHQPPDMPNGAMLAVYKPYRDGQRHPWLYGEYCERGFERSDAGYWWRLTAADAGANIYPPSMVPAIWTKLEAVEEIE